MGTIRIAEHCGHYVSSTRSASNLRAQIEELVDAGSTVSVDFSDVESVSPSFLYGLIGVLAAQRGRTWLDENVKITGVSPGDRSDIEKVLACHDEEHATN